MSTAADEAARARIPDVPAWVDTRGMLLTGRAVVSFAPGANFATDGFVVELASRALVSIVGRPPAALIAGRVRNLEADVNVLCALETADAVESVLPGWRRHAALVHALPSVQPWESDVDPGVTVFTQADGPPSLAHVPEPLRTELVETLEGHPVARFVPGELPPAMPADRSLQAIPMASAWADGLPVAFCYPVLQTETLWDVSVDTLPAFRGRGLAGRAARAMTRHMRRLGKAPVWGALETNGASLGAARRLGFVLSGRLAVFTAA
jgi:RimJ/RimL family protein N-acetyltransferase